MIQSIQLVNLEKLHEELEQLPNMVVDGVPRYVVIVNDLGSRGDEVIISPFFGEQIDEEAIRLVLAAHNPSEPSRKQVEEEKRAERAREMARIAAGLPGTLRKARREARQSEHREILEPILDSIDKLSMLVLGLYSERPK